MHFKSIGHFKEIVQPKYFFFHELLGMKEEEEDPFRAQAPNGRL